MTQLNYGPISASLATLKANKMHVKFVFSV